MPAEGGGDLDGFDWDSNIAMAIVHRRCVIIRVVDSALRHINELGKDGLLGN